MSYYLFAKPTTHTLDFVIVAMIGSPNSLWVAHICMSIIIMFFSQRKLPIRTHELFPFIVLI